MIRVIKKDNTKEEFNVQKVVNAVNKSATRVMYEFTPTEIEYISSYVTEKAEAFHTDEITIAQMHNIVEGALEATNPDVAKSYKDYRNYKQDFVSSWTRCTRRVSQSCTSATRRTPTQIPRLFPPSGALFSTN